MPFQHDKINTSHTLYRPPSSAYFDACGVLNRQTISKIERVCSMQSHPSSKRRNVQCMLSNKKNSPSEDFSSAIRGSSSDFPSCAGKSPMWRELKTRIFYVFLCRLPEQKSRLFDHRDKKRKKSREKVW
ncbi:hypothetical protein CPSG_08141 [Coccidioides posadasii str. Silveira]|uniref:Uncharacterized protein n=1 Tax=Coccidioides posadasii (strain RMSCC 757 / Silveira) TaxID=443226 RepID=E9DDH9_COCPS|nr:hypothetical protein CPSG_08141 [Coccidioides posadasii str. Silveira]